MYIKDSIAFWARHEPSRPAVAVGDRVLYSYGELHARTVGLATWLSSTETGLQRGDRVIILVLNTVEFFESLFACWQAGLIAVPVNTRLHPREIRYIVKQCSASFCLASEELTGRFIEAGVPVLGVGSKSYQTACESGALILRKSDADDTQVAGVRSRDDTAWIFYTSGTTGQPKGAMLSFKNLEIMCQCYFRDVDVDPPWTHILHPAPLSHGSGLYALAHFLKGSCQVLPESAGFAEDEIFNLIANWSNSVFFAAPTMIRRLTHTDIDTDTTNLKAVLFGGAPMYFEDICDYVDRFGPRLAQLYGQGESPMTITSYSSAVMADRTHPRWKQRVSSAGRAQSAVSVACVDDQGHRVEPGEIGEVIVKGQTVMKGYWQDPQATANSLREGWLYTGDMGYFDEDGYLTLKDRSKDLLISGGSNIYPREVEEVLLTHADVDEVSIIGKADREWGEVVVAYVVSERFNRTVASLSAEYSPTGVNRSLEHHEDSFKKALDSICLESLARYKRPRIYRFVDSLPKNNYGKVLKTKLRSLEQGINPTLE